MYIEPSTNIKLLNRVPLDNTYTNTIFFLSASEQTAYFSSKVKHNLQQQTYQRLNRGVCRIGLKSDYCYDCNYMMFQNPSYGQKWFYAFITSVEYLNDNVCEIRYEIDKLQTWLFDFNLKQCFVEREHSVTDVAGDNLVIEKIDTGEYVADNYYSDKVHREMVYIIAVSGSETGDAVQGGTYAGTYSGVQFRKFSNTSDVNNALEIYASNGLIDSVLGVYEVYEDYLGYNSGVPYVGEISVSKPTSIGNYTPKNKKLLTYPYCFMLAESGDGNNNTYMYEYFSDVVCKYEVYATFNGLASLLLYPFNYKGIQNNYDETLSMNNASVQCAYNVDAFKAWLAQNSVNLVTSTAQGLIGVATGNVGSAINTVGTLANVEIKRRTTSPKATMGGNGAINQLVQLNEMKVYTKRIQRQFAERVDDYFTRFGYATNRLKVPNISSRPYWNYVKTVDCTITGSVPADDMREICSIHDKGVTYWKNGNDIGNYLLDNSPS